MKRHSLALAAVLVLIVALTSSGAASAGAYKAGSGFRVGEVYFHVVSVSPESGALFRITERLPGHGAVRHTGCYRVGRAFYHPEACAAVQAHFARYGAVADSSPPPASVERASYGTGSHPIDYLRGGYVEPERSYDRAYAGLFYGAWLAPRGHRGGFRARGFGFRGGGGRFGGFARGFVGPGSVNVSIRGW